MKFYPKLNLQDDQDMRDKVRDMSKYISKKELRAQGKVNALIARIRSKARGGKPASFGGVEDKYYVSSHVPTRAHLREMGVLAGFGEIAAPVPTALVLAGITTIVSWLLESHPQGINFTDKEELKISLMRFVINFVALGSGLFVLSKFKRR